MNDYYLTTILSHWESSGFPLIGLGINTVVAIFLYSKERRHIIWVISKCAIALSLMATLPLAISSIGIPVISRSHELIVLISLVSTIISAIIGLGLSVSSLFGIKSETNSEINSSGQKKGLYPQNIQNRADFNMNNNDDIRENTATNEDFIMQGLSDDILPDITSAKTVEAFNKIDQSPQTNLKGSQKSSQTITKFKSEITSTDSGNYQASRNITLPVQNSILISDYPLLVVNGGPDSGKSLLVKQNEAYIGRSTDSDLYVDDKTISRLHAIIKKYDGNYFVYDAGSKAGLYVNDIKVPRKSLSEKSTVKVGETRFKIIDIGGKNKTGAYPGYANKTVAASNVNPHKMLVVSEGMDRGQTFLLKEGANTIGRDSTCSVSLSDPTISRQQCSINVSQSSELTSISDLGSKTSTRVDGIVLSGLKLNNGDVLKMGKTSVMFLMTSNIKD